MTVERFEAELTEDALANLAQRLRGTRWPHLIGTDDWRYGVPRGWLMDMVDYWIDEWDWQHQADRMNRFEHLRLTVDGIRLHVMHAPGVGPKPMPLVLTHGWPWTFWDFSEVIGPLSDPAAHGGDAADAFDVYVPSLPGFGFSTPLTSTGVGVQRIAGLWAAMMTEIGVDRFAAHGGDWGSIVTAELGHRYPERLVGIHQALSWIPGVDRRAMDDGLWSDDEAWMRDRNREVEPLIRSHWAVHALDPQTFAYALADSPAGTAAWLWERRQLWSGGPPDAEVFHPDHLCTTAALYWCTGAMTSSMRIYHEQLGWPWEPAHDRSPRVDVPTAVAVFPEDLVFLPKALYEQHTDLRRWTHMPAGGHFAAMEQPGLLVDDLRAFFGDLR